MLSTKQMNLEVNNMYQLKVSINPTDDAFQHGHHSDKVLELDLITGKLRAVIRVIKINNRVYFPIVELNYFDVIEFVEQHRNQFQYLLDNIADQFELNYDADFMRIELNEALKVLRKTKH